MTARTNAGEDSNEFDPASTPSSSTIATQLVGQLNISSWANGGNSTVDEKMLALQVSCSALIGKKSVSCATRLP